MDGDLEKALSLAEDVILVLEISNVGGEGRGRKQDSRWAVRPSASTWLAKPDLESLPHP